MVLLLPNSQCWEAAPRQEQGISSNSRVQEEQSSRVSNPCRGEKPRENLHKWIQINPLGFTPPLAMQNGDSKSQQGLILFLFLILELPFQWAENEI